MKQTRRFENTGESVAAARRFASDVLQDLPAEVRHTVALMVSELATNCVRHTDSDFELTISQTGGEIRVEARDCGGGRPTMRTPAVTDPSGRGLQIIDIFSTAWGHESRPGGKVVWFSLSLEAATAA
jgi:anti-sigma regulatory factor (Ser/Thr protein kinase)